MSEEHTRLERIKAIFEQARHLLPAEQPDFVRSLCRDDPDADAVIGEVLSLLAELDAAAGFLEAPTMAAAALGAAMIANPSLGEAEGSRIGPYKLLERIGEGGFGMVYMAEQVEPIRRRVALKIIKLGMDTAQVIARFEQERQALAMMDHLNIAKVLDAGATPTGRPYFVMELVRGEPITAFCDARRLSIPARLELFAQVCRAVQHAHQKGIIHRDIKPSNVLVTMGDGDRPIPKIIDFGIAKATQSRLTDKTLFTEFRQMIGTPEYMSPEQAGMGAASGLDIDTRSDVYSLGVLLYELLTGVTPFDPQKLRSAAFGELQRIIREDDPPRPSTRLSTLATAAQTAQRRGLEPRRLGMLVRGELDWVVMKCLEKDRSRRYTSADDLARDLERFLNQEPLEAAPPTASYLASKFIRRNRHAVVVVGAVAAAMVLGLAGTSVTAAWALRERDRSNESERQAIDDRIRAEAAARAEAAERRRADETADAASRLAYSLAISSATAGLESGNIDLAIESLRESPEPLRGWEWHHLRWAAGSSAPEFKTPQDTDAFVGSMDGSILATRSPDGEVLVFDAHSTELLRRVATPPGPTANAYSMELDPLARLLLVCQRDADDKPLTSVIELATGRTLWSTNAISSFTGSGNWVTSFVPGGVAVRDAATGAQHDFIPLESETPISFSVVVGPNEPIFINLANSEKLVYSLRDRKLVTRYTTWESAFFLDEPEVVRWSPSSQMLERVSLVTGEMTPLNAAPALRGAHMDGLGKGLIVSVDDDGRMRALSLRDGSQIAEINLPTSARRWRPAADGHTVFVMSRQGVIQRRSLAEARQPFIVEHAGRTAYDARVSPKGDRTAITGWGEVRLYDTQAGQNLWSSYHTTAMLYASAFSPDGRLLVVGGGTPSLALLDTADGRVLSMLELGQPGIVTTLEWSPSGDRIVAGLTTGALLEWNPHRPTDPPIAWPDAHDTAVAALAFSSDGALLASASASDLWIPDFHSALPDGRNEVVIWHASGRTRARTIAEDNPGYRCLTFAPDNATLAIGTRRTLTLLDPANGQTLTTSDGPFRAVAFSPDGARLAAVTEGQRLKVLDARDLSLKANFRSNPGARVDLAFTPDGSTLLMAAPTAPIAAWESRPPTAPMQRIRVSAAQAIVSSLFREENELLERVIARINADPSLSASQRHMALELATARGNNPNRLTNIAAVRLADPAVAPDEAARMAELAETAIGIVPESRWAWQTLTVAHHRAGLYEEAIAAATKSLELSPSGVPFDAVAWSIIAISQQELGRSDEARQALAEAEQIAQRQGVSSRLVRLYLSEARSLIPSD